jgi:hypothetical protein
LYGVSKVGGRRELLESVVEKELVVPNPRPREVVLEPERSRG